MGDPRNGQSHDRPPLRLAATYTAAPIVDSLAELGDRLQWPMGVSETPYGRFAMHLADRGSPFWDDATARVIFWRADDQGRDPDKAVRTLSDAVTAGADGRPLLIIVGAASADLERDVAALIGDQLAALQGIVIRTMSKLAADFGLAEVRDKLTDQAGHVPWTDNGLAAIALGTARWVDGLVRPPVKLIAVDADHTLWRGVLGEDGADGIRLDAPFADLQRRLKEAADNGVILAMLTKNEDSDIRDVLSVRTDFPLKPKNFLTIRAGWDDKAAALAEVLADYGLGATAAVFLDDNPVECARMRAALPDVLTIAVPEEGPEARFLDNLWPLDLGTATADDRKRVERYREEETRASAKRQSADLNEFFSRLELKVDVFTPATDEISRITQLSQRTNQFSTTLLRLNYSEVVARLSAIGGYVRGIRVSDRFGDYGVVGLLYGSTEGGILNIELFAMSCRVLGRGVEQEILRHISSEAGVAVVRFPYVTGPRNRPALNFLASLTDTSLDKAGTIEADAAALRDIRFDPHADNTATETISSCTGASTSSRCETYDRIANGLHAGEPPSALFTSTQPRPSLDTAFVPPRGEVEQAIAAIWSSVLGIEAVGRDDDFQALGGRSLKLVRIYARLVREMKADISLADLFRFSTVAALASHLGGEKVRGNPRAAAMRAARLRYAGKAS